MKQQSVTLKRKSAYFQIKPFIHDYEQELQKDLIETLLQEDQQITFVHGLWSMFEDWNQEYPDEDIQQEIDKAKSISQQE